VLYILLLAAVCVAYTHRLISPIRPLSRQVEALNEGRYSSRVRLRKGDLDLYNEYAARLNELAARLEKSARNG
jgi:signal transduction histidine kinase